MVTKGMKSIAFDEGFDCIGEVLGVWVKEFINDFRKIWTVKRNVLVCFG